MARIAALTAGPCFDHHSEEKANDDDEEQEKKKKIVVTLTEAMCPPKSSCANMNPKIIGTDSSSSSDDGIHETLQSTIYKTNNLTTLIKHTAKLRLALHASINIANDVSARHADLLRHSGELSAAAERLQHEEQIFLI